MVALSALWLPLLLATVLVFLASSVIHMAPLWHRNEYPRVPDEARLQDALRPLALPPGDYMVPRAMSGAEMKSPEYAAKLQQGPVLVMTVLPNGPFSMGRNLAQWFVYVFVVLLFAAYVASRALPAGADYLSVFRFAGTTAFIGFAVALWQMSIWWRRSWSITLKATLDGLIYALLAAGVFGWLWP